jgi:hypothetical protein
MTVHLSIPMSVHHKNVNFAVCKFKNKLEKMFLLF